jgi:hypothetical protein
MKMIHGFEYDPNLEKQDENRHCRDSVILQPQYQELPLLIVLKSTLVKWPP